MTIRSRLRLFAKRRKPDREPAILMYHRIAALHRDPWGLAVSPAHFRAQLEQLRREREILPLNELFRLSRAEQVSRRAVAITFDDGYRDNLVSAAPILTAFDAPATLFLATGPMRRQVGYWWDILESMILDAAPVEGVVRIGSEDVVVALDRPEFGDGVHSCWRAWQPPRTARERLYLHIWSLIRPLSPAANDAAMAALGALFRPDPQLAAGPMTEREVRTLIAQSPFSLACHTVDHPDLSAVPRDVAKDQIVANKAEVEAIAGTPVTGFAYPYGRSNGDVEALVNAAGFTHACTTQALPFAGCRPMALPRRTARDRPTIDWLED